MDADDAHEDQADVADDNSAVFDGIRHGQDTSTNVTLEKMNDDIGVGDLWSFILCLNDWSLLTRRLPQNIRFQLINLGPKYSEFVEISVLCHKN